MSADNITVLVVEFDWGEEGSSLSVNSLASMEQAAHTSSGSNRWAQSRAAACNTAAAFLCGAYGCPAAMGWPHPRSILAWCPYRACS